jgi:hypothetical protein
MSLSSSDRLDDCLQTVVAARPGQAGLSPSLFAAIVAETVRQAMSVRERAAQTWQWRRRMGELVMKRRSN